MFGGSLSRASTLVAKGLDRGWLLEMVPVDQRTANFIGPASVIAAMKGTFPRQACGRALAQAADAKPARLPLLFLQPMATQRLCLGMAHRCIEGGGT
jgi:hypothetical protein